MKLQINKSERVEVEVDEELLQKYFEALLKDKDVLPIITEMKIHPPTILYTEFEFSDKTKKLIRQVLKKWSKYAKFMRLVPKNLLGVSFEEI